MTSARSMNGVRLTRAILAVVVAGAVMWGGPVAGQEGGPAQAGEGGNVALTLVEAKSPFFLAGPKAVLASNPRAYVRRASIAGDGDQQLIVATLSDGDVIAAQSVTVRGIDRIAEVGGTATFWGEVLKQTQPLTADASPTVGFILAAYGGRDPTVRADSITAASGALQGIDEVFLVARMRGGADLLAMYAIDGADLATAAATAEAIQGALTASELEIEIEGLATKP